ncbi:ABC transporter permease subunit [Candidatus Poribacteria bacterium]|nr:ABC transporter permease subunit [Candidatus Poribacteria bacterium]MYA99115.1 ABC transporter permease subunit [Candidatus Poribacteria bacterium]
MLRTLIRQELLTHLMSARFFAAVVITLLLVVANAVVLLEDYERRLAKYNQQENAHREKAQEAKTYSTLKLSVERPPNPLSLFSAGLDKRLGSTFDIYHGFVPMISDGSARSLDNTFLNLFSKSDLVLIFQIVLSLMALLFAYDAIAGDWESGTLRLVISHPVRRGSILLAKYIGAIVCLLLPVLMSLLMVLILLSTVDSIQLDGEDFLRIGGIILTTTIYLSAFYLIGLLISTATRRTATSLMLCMFLWVALVLVYPNWSRFTITPVGDTRAIHSSANQQIEQIWEEVDREKDQFLANSPLEGEPQGFNLQTRQSNSFSSGGSLSKRYGIDMKLWNPSDPLVPHVQDYHATMGALHIRSAEQIALVRKQTLDSTSLQESIWHERLMKLSPASLYTFATAAWAGTDLDGMSDFLQAVQGYRRTIIDYFHDKDAFSSRQWFASDKGTVDWWDLPQFHFDRTDASENATRALPELFLLLLINLVLFTGTFLTFTKIEV